MTMRMSEPGKITEGTQVVLKEFRDGGILIPEERAVVIEVADQKKYPGMMIVQVEEPLGPGDDRIREVHVENVKEVIS